MLRYPIMRQLQPVLWTKGVLLNPQHLQTQDRFLEDLLEFQLSTLTVFPWGFSRLEIDREALAGGAIAIASAAGILPDGLLFDMPMADPPPPPRPLEGCWEADQESLDVFLTIPEYRPGGYNVSAAQRVRNTRYAAEVLMRRDENTGLAEKPIQVARKNFRLLVEGESLEGSSVLRMARVVRSATGGYQLHPRFVPPLIDIAANDYVLAIARRIVEILSAKSTSLSGTRRQKNQSLADFSLSDVASFWLLYTINGHLPQFRHLLETRRGHPAGLYSAMVALAGALTTFSFNIHPRLLPSYDHENLSACFTDLDEKLRILLDTVVPSNCVSLPLRLVQPSIYATAIDQDRYFDAPQFYLAVSADSNQAELLRKTPQLVKLSSHDGIDRLVRQALPGLGLTYVANPPSAIPVKLSHHYFLINKSGKEWESVVRARNLAAFVPAEIPDPQMELVIILPAGE
jgi:type VI secretion system protein ImpJ